MSLKEEYEKICVQKKKGEYKEQVKLECKTDIPSDDVKRVIAVLPSARIVKSEQKDEITTATGSVNYYICYVDGENKFKKTEVRGEFTAKIKVDGEVVKTTCEAVIDKTETDVSGLTFSVYSFVTVVVTGYSDCGFEALSGGENLIVNSREISYQKGLGTAVSQTPVVEEFEVDYQIKQVLTQQAVVTVSEVQCGVGSIIVDGELHLSAILLQSGEKESIIKEKKVIAFRGEIECEKCSPEMTAICSATVRSFKTDIAVDEQKNVSRITANVVVTLEGEAFTNEKCSIADDVFSTECNLDLVKGEAVTGQATKQCGYTEELNAVIPFEVEGNCVLVSTANEKAEIYSVNHEDNSVVVSGSLIFNQIYQAENGFFSRKCETPFEQKLDGTFNAEHTVRATVVDCKTEIRSATDISVKAEVCFSVVSTEKQPLKFIKEVKDAGAKKGEESSLSVYIPAPDEDLWTLSKHLNTSPEDLLETNKELTFPLTGEERIVVYRQRKKENQV